MPDVTVEARLTVTVSADARGTYDGATLDERARSYGHQSAAAYLALAYVEGWYRDAPDMDGWADFPAGSYGVRLVDTEVVDG